ncbi:hypothetical protein Fuma_03919 [Fuerstiella marisgermanici]|uniref:Uncharacterized protein n=1 Tax=Fuerstiella marisgermanici TaxID=1891926 RepID=A0A1P8WJS2_9PLAN|nr:hypothetical protein Fuma_03919 [Fuerstiella marisgermanici]
MEIGRGPQYRCNGVVEQDGFAASMGVDRSLRCSSVDDAWLMPCENTRQRTINQLRHHVGITPWTTLRVKAFDP